MGQVSRASGTEPGKSPGLSREDLEELKAAIMAAIKPWLNVKEAAVYLGISVSKIYKLTAKKRLSQHYIEGKIVFSRADLDLVPKKKRCMKAENQFLDDFASNLRHQAKTL